MSDEHLAYSPSLPCAPGVDGLRHAVRLYALDGFAAIPDDPLRASARMMSDDARQRGLHVEQLLVSLKRAWPALINSEGVSRSASSKLFARFVTFCVEEYYAPSRSVGTSHHPGE